MDIAANAGCPCFRLANGRLERPQNDHGYPAYFTEQGFATTFKIAEAMVKSGILPRGIDNPYKAFAIIQKGREMGVEPMRALTGIYLIEGKTVVSPELKLECFRARGGKVQWVESTGAVAHVK